MSTISFKMRVFDEGELQKSGQEVRTLDVSSCSLNELPLPVRSLALSLEILNITWNQLRQLPQWLGELQLLTCFDCSFNQLEMIPTSIQKLRRLKELHLSDNNLRVLPDLGSLTALTSLNLQYNQLECVPD
jgi:leucine-rich repeat protein SHOC2